MRWGWDGRSGGGVDMGRIEEGWMEGWETSQLERERRSCSPLLSFFDDDSDNALTAHL